MMKRWLVLILGATMSHPAFSQLTAPVKNGEPIITVTGTRSRDSKVEMSKWRVAETPHVVVFSQNDDEELRYTAHNLEKLHFLLSAQFGRIEAPDDTIKIAVVMIGHAGEFEMLRLTDLRWQYGPFPAKFAKTIYYDPREEGSILATTQDGVNLVLSPSLGRPTNRNCDGGNRGAPLTHVYARPWVSPTGQTPTELTQALDQFPINEVAICQPAESRLYAGFAQNYLMTYFPAAYPRWFLQGFGELFATIQTGDDFVEYGYLPPGFFQVMDHYGGYPVADVLNGRYLTGQGRYWTPYHAWRLVHLLYFSDEWKPRLMNYLKELAQGADLEGAAHAFGDQAQLQKALSAYRGRNVPYERIDFPVEYVQVPSIRQMTRAEAGLIRGRLELGARIEVPDVEGRERSEALERRAEWLERLRENARSFPNLIENQLLLAEAECRSGNPQECLEAAERALAKSSRDSTALVWKGTALVQLAAHAPPAERSRRLEEARKFIARANRRDKDGILPLIAYYNSFAITGEPAAEMAVEGLAKVVHSSPAAPSARLKMGGELIKRNRGDASRNMLLPVAKGPFTTPEQPAAAALLRKAQGAEPEG